MNEPKKRVTGIGGIFFKSSDVDKTKAWYAKHLGIAMDKFGASFVSKQFADPEKSHHLQWSPFTADTDYFKPSEKGFMFNYRVEDLEWLVSKLKEEGVTICDKIETYDYGKFVHIMDEDGNKIELWEPVDEVFDAYHKDKPRNF